MKTIRGVSIAVLVLGLATACSQGADPDAFPTFPPPAGPGSATADDGQATFGVDTESGAAGSCCLPQDGPGCNDELVESCVCAQSPSCCSNVWTGECASLVDELDCGLCSGGPLDEAGEDPDESGPPPPSGQDCCVGGPEPGCNDATVESCVCAEIPFCCDTGWEKVCGSAVEALGCGHCGGVGETGEDPPPGETGEDPPPGDTGGDPPPPTGGCCEVQMTPGCDDAGVQDCVCMQDAYCCDTAWDQVCIDEVAMFMCGDCGGEMPPPDESSCCSEQMGAGCGDPLVEACVCLVDSYCCETQWDATCAIFVELFMCPGAACS
jgi:hypothetical protein